MSAEESLFTFRVEGIETGHRSYVKPFDETYEIAGEHPAEALEKLLREIEWGILDSEQPFTVAFVPGPSGKERGARAGETVCGCRHTTVWLHTGPYSGGGSCCAETVRDCCCGRNVRPRGSVSPSGKEQP